ncbi:TROVE domain-containing protein [Asticcacaulis excentricus]|uniref:TROVE domain-containing protein n=1 Tax=Asticcacaulis excentricus (strain ATCC 15261 / DSM 4724 / KCTC 12464 / NCIMB 9791 / VKM B-1370 / CB 48) TaxID=573065 RepID=E8RLJ1_ASTEC|nr:TROVE domain-containing protein [Asticcacaulis excentricus]ADU13735.1 TROVE domain-containing protein [Asticcacaulis excentricus CB 48]
MRLNIFQKRPRITHEGAPAAILSAEQRLRRSVLSCLLWEGEFYEDGESIAERIYTLALEVEPQIVAAMAIEAREQMKLRHAPLILLCALIKTGGPLVAPAIERVIQRADELSELVAIYWRDGKKPLSKQMKLGLSRAFTKFDAYALAKYDRAGPVRLRDVLFLIHAKPKDEIQADLWKHLAAGTLSSPDTWEVALSGGADKAETFTRLLTERKLGYLALLRNLRNMDQAGVDEELVKAAILARKGAERVLPFRYVAAARAAPRFEPWLDQALSETILEQPVFAGRTIVLVDVSGSMGGRLSAKSDLTRMDAAATLAAIIPGEVRVFTFSNSVVEVPPRRGMAGVDAILRSQSYAGTELGKAVTTINGIKHDRLIVITDEQSADRVPQPVAKQAYMINVASYRNGVGYGGTWTHIDGFSENVLSYIREQEQLVKGA